MNADTERAQGFTLIEVLIAIFIFTLVVSVVFTSFREIAFSAAMVNQGGDLEEMAFGAMGIMQRDLESMYVVQKPGYVPPGFGDDPDPYRVGGVTEPLSGSMFPRLRFTSLSHLPVNRDQRGGIAEVVYYMDESREYGMILRRSDRIFFSEEFEKRPSDPVLLRKIKTLTFTYIDEEGAEHDSWDSDAEEFDYATPSAIVIRMEIEDGDRVMPFHTRVHLRCVREKTS